MKIRRRVSMAKLTTDIHEEILIRLDVKDLLRCKSVCKSWYSLISSQRFIKAHLNQSYNQDRKIGHRRIFVSKFGGEKGSPLYEGTETFFERISSFLVGSHNGLVCVAPFCAQPLVVNPSTREVKKLQEPNIPARLMWSSLCWGFGYDPSTEDYKVILGFMRNENRTCFQLLSLKSNVWKDIGELNYGFISNIGTLCYGRLYWFMNDQNKKKVIVSFDLSKEEFKEIPPPADAIIKGCYFLALGVIKECLCIYQFQLPASSEKWVLENDNVKQHWKLLPYGYEMEYDIVHYMREQRDYVPQGGHYMPYRESFCYDNVCVSKSGAYIGAPIFVQSLVSPHADERPKRKTVNKKRSIKVFRTSHMDVTRHHAAHSDSEDEENRAQLPGRPKRTRVMPARYRHFVTSYGTRKEGCWNLEFM